LVHEYPVIGRDTTHPAVADAEGTSQPGEAPAKQGLAQRGSAGTIDVMTGQSTPTAPRLGISLAMAGLPIPEAQRLAKMAEQGGMGFVSVGEVAYDAFAAATALALATEHIEVWTGIATWTRPPVLTAMAASTVDSVSNGRFRLGLGTMPAAWNIDHYGIDPSRPIGRMREYVAAIRAAWLAHSGRSCEFTGERFTITGYRRPEPPLRDEIPILLAATRPQMAKLAGEIADGAYLNVIHTVDWISEVLNPAVAQGRAKATAGAPAQAGPHETGVMVRCSIHDDQELALQRLRTSLRMYLLVPYLAEVAAHAGFDIGNAVEAAKRGDFDRGLALLPDDLVAKLGVAGTPAQCAEQLRAYDGLVDWIVFAPPSRTPPDTGIEPIEAIIEAELHP
jgi:5,10-methylenetetrahydromethanopterin reductase